MCRLLHSLSLRQPVFFHITQRMLVQQYDPKLISVCPAKEFAKMCTLYLSYQNAAFFR